MGELGAWIVAQVNAGIKTLGWRDLAQMGQTTCSRCTLVRKLTATEAKHLERLILHNELANAM